MDKDSSILHEALLFAYILCTHSRTQKPRDRKVCVILCRFVMHETHMYYIIKTQNYSAMLSRQIHLSPLRLSVPSFTQPPISFPVVLQLCHLKSVI